MYSMEHTNTIQVSVLLVIPVTFVNCLSLRRRKSEMRFLISLQKYEKNYYRPLLLNRLQRIAWQQGQNLANHPSIYWPFIH